MHVFISEFSVTYAKSPVQSPKVIPLIHDTPNVIESKLLKMTFGLATWVYTAK